VTEIFASRMLVTGIPFLLGDFQEVCAIGALDGTSQRLEALASDQTLAVGDFLEAGDLQALALLDGLEEAGGLEQRFRRAGVEPGETAAEGLHA